MQVVVEGVGPAGAEVGADTVDCEVHLRQPPSVLVRLLAVHGDVERATTMRLDEPFRLDEHTAGAAAWVVYTAAR